MRDVLLRVKQGHLSLTEVGTLAIIGHYGFVRKNRACTMFGRLAISTRLTALVAALAYTLLPATLLAKCGCDDCVCSAETDAGNCCCTQAKFTTEVKAHSCCKPQIAACPTCGNAALATSAVSGCACQPEYSSPAPSQPVLRSSALEDQAAPTADHFAPVLPVQRPESDTFYRLADLDPTADTPPLHLLHCVWRN
jgi:hypothetical protein